LIRPVSLRFSCSRSSCSVAASSGYGRVTIRTRTGAACARTPGYRPIRRPPPTSGCRTRYFDRRIRADVAKELAAKGYRPAESGEKPDFLLNYRLASEPASVMRSDPHGYWGGVWGASWMAGGDAYYTDNYDEARSTSRRSTRRRSAWSGSDWRRPGSSRPCRWSGRRSGSTPPFTRFSSACPTAES
jgi:hypothetical protein